MTKIGILISAAKSIVSSYSQLKAARVQRIPGIILKHMDMRSLLFLPAYCGSFKLINCLLNRLFGDDTLKNSVVSGFISGMFYMLYPQFPLISYALIRSVQLMWMKHIKSYSGDDKMRNHLKSLPMALIVLWLSGSVLFICRVMYPHMSSKYMVDTFNYISGSL